MTTREQLQERLGDALVKVEQAFPLFAMHHMGEPSDALAEFFENLDSDQAKKIWPDIELPASDDLDTDPEAMLEALQHYGKTGWLIEVSTPSNVHRVGKSGFSFSWGSSYGNWIYAETFEEALERSIEWATQQLEKQLAKQKPAKGGVRHG